MVNKKDNKETKKQVVKLPGGKRINAARGNVDQEKIYDISDAIKMVKDTATAKFDETVEVVLNLGIDPKHSSQNVRGVVSMPNGIGKTVRVAVFAKDKKADEAKKAGADIIGAEDLIEQVSKGEINFDRCVATPDIMPQLGKAAKVLGPSGLMPNPKLGTVTTELEKAIKDIKSGQVEFRTEKSPIVQAGIGKASFADKDLIENIKAFVNAVTKAKPDGVKGTYLKRASISSTMGPGIKINLASIAA